MDEYQRVNEVNKTQAKESHRGSTTTRYITAVEADDFRTLMTQNTQQSVVEASQLNLLITSRSDEDSKKMRHETNHSTKPKLTGDQVEMKEQFYKELDQGP